MDYTSFIIVDHLQALAYTTLEVGKGSVGWIVTPQIGHARYGQRAQQLVARLEGSGSRKPWPNPADREGVAAAFDMLTSNGWRIVGPIQRIWAGERDAVLLTEGLDARHTLIVRAVLRRL